MIVLHRLLPLVLVIGFATSSPADEAPLRAGPIRVVNVGGPMNGVLTGRGLRPDFRHVDLKAGPNTVVADVNRVDLSRLFGSGVRFLRASNVPFAEVPSGAFVRPEIFAAQARRLGVDHIALTTGPKGIEPIRRALEAEGFVIRHVSAPPGRRASLTARSPAAARRLAGASAR